MKALAIIINLFFPGIGTLIVKKYGQGITQIILTVIAAILVFTGILSIVGIPLGIGVWIWAIVSAASSNTQEPIVVKEVIREVSVDNSKKEEEVK